MGSKWTIDDIKGKGLHIGEDGIAKKLVKPKTNKYGVNPKEKRTYNGTVYASTAEMKYRIKLDTIVKYNNEENPISKIEEQVKFPIEIKGYNPFITTSTRTLCIRILIHRSLLVVKNRLPT